MYIKYMCFTKKKRNKAHWLNVLNEQGCQLFRGGISAVHEISDDKEPDMNNKIGQYTVINR